jgi:hypothetical protein
MAEACGSVTCSAGNICQNGVCTDVRCIGVTCPAGRVCREGACRQVCIEGDGCATNPAAPCKTGVYSCANNTTTCVDGAPADAGVACSVDHVCDGVGSCVQCGSASSCSSNPGAPCKLGMVSCTTGGCADGLNAAVGTSCGGGQVCDAMGVCVPCSAGTACSTNPTPCKQGVTACGTGTSTCLDGPNDAAPGASCGNNLVCDGSGGCVACTAGLSCTTNPNPCKQGGTACGTGTSVCLDGTTNLDAGAACGTSQVCNGNGACVGCVADAGCAMNPGNPCKLGAIVCGSGAPVCADKSNVPNGTTCSTNQVCIGGSCVPCSSTSQCLNGLNCISGGCRAPLASCPDTKAAYPAATSGEYYLNPGTAVLAYCDMVQNRELCRSGSYATHTGVTRDGSGLAYSLVSRMSSSTYGAGSCTFYALYNPPTGRPFEAHVNGTCMALGFRADISIGACLFGLNPGWSSCGFPIVDWYWWGTTCTGCVLNNGTYPSYVVQGPIGAGGVPTDYSGSTTSTCATH